MTAVEQPVRPAEAGGDVAARRGRPRSAEADAAIVEATLELIAEQGVTGLSVESVAVKAGVGKATIYRRWPSKEALVEEALARLAEEVPVVPTTEPTVRGQLIEMLEQIRCKSPETLTSRIMPRMLSHASRSPDLFKLFYTQVIGPRRDRVAAALQAGVDSGELRPDLDVALAVTLVTAPMVYLNMIQAANGRPGPEVSVALVDLALSGIGVPAAPC